jgi:hypothetical protein
MGGGAVEKGPASRQEPNFGQMVREAVLLVVSAFAVTAVTLSAADGAGAIDTCPYLPQFKALERNIAGMPPAAGLAAIAHYEADPENENPAACESFALDDLMSEREKKLVALVDGKTKLHAQSAFHCDALLEGTTKCNGVFEDGTAHPLSGGIRPRHLKEAATLRLESALPDAQLDGVYLAPIGDLLDGKPATRLDAAAGEITLAPPHGLTALMVIFRAPPPWSYRKLVWYFQ